MESISAPQYLQFTFTTSLITICCIGVCFGVRSISGGGGGGGCSIGGVYTGRWDGCFGSLLLFLEVTYRPIKRMMIKATIASGIAYVTRFEMTVGVTIAVIVGVTGSVVGGLVVGAVAS